MLLDDAVLTRTQFNELSFTDWPQDQEYQVVERVNEEILETGFAELLFAKNEDHYSVTFEISGNQKYYGGLFSWSAVVSSIAEEVEEDTRLSLVHTSIEEPNHIEVTFEMQIPTSELASPTELLAAADKVVEDLRAAASVRLRKKAIDYLV